MLVLTTTTFLIFHISHFIIAHTATPNLSLTKAPADCHYAAVGIEYISIKNLPWTSPSPPPALHKSDRGSCKTFPLHLSKHIRFDFSALKPSYLTKPP